jgi:prepilin peptidase CpaA
LISPFFPHAAFGWLFYGLMLACCLALVATDLKSQRLPNRLTVTMLLLGIVMNLVRASWLGVHGEPGRYFGWTGFFGGFLEGITFSLAGFAVAFIFFTILWQLQKCGAGDVKMMAALGAWIGPYWFLFVLAGTIVAVLIIMLVWWLTAFVLKRNPGLKISYALPASISFAVLMLWFWRHMICGN